MKYYIPTSTLNIESILSTESISPISYYAERPFGSRFFQKISGINMDSSLFLFSKVPLFNIYDTEVEQYAIAIEIEDDAQLKKMEITPVYNDNEFSVLSCSKTIVLTPWNSRIIYFDERAYHQSRLSIETSRNCKIGLKFPWVFKDEGVLLEEMVAKVSDDLPGEGPNDLAFNVEKGAIWGYILGCSRSLSGKAAKLVAISNRMRNIASNAISNSGECGQAFYGELKELDKAYREIADRETNDQWNKSCSLEERRILDKFQVSKEALCKFLKIKRLTLSPEIPHSKDSKDTWITYRDLLNAYTEAFVNKEHQESSSVLWNNISFQDSHLSLNNCELINCILKKIREGELNKERIRINREASMKVVLSEVSGILQKRYSKETWEHLPKERLYINQLFKNISDFEPFNPNDIEDDELKAIAAFLLKGEDFDALVRYLEDNSFANYRLVLCLWGALEGYASIHKNLLSSVLSADNVSKVNILLGIQTTSMPFPAEVFIPKTFNYNPTEKRNVRIESEHRLDVNEKCAQNVNYNPKTFDNRFEEFFSSFVAQCKAAKNDKSIYRRLFNQYSGITEDFYKAVEAEKNLNKGKGPQKNVLQYIEKLVRPSDNVVKNKRKYSSSVVSPTVFDDQVPSTGIFLKDLEFLSTNSEFKSLASSSHRDWLTDLIWFIDAHRPESKKEYYKGKPTDNKTVVIQFLSLRNNRYYSTKNFLFRVYNIDG